MIDRSIAPEIHTLLSINMKEPILDTLENGISFFQFPNAELELIHIQLDIRTGALYEPKKHLSLMTYGLLKGSHPRMEISEMADLLQFYGSTFNADIYLDSVCLKMVMPKRNLQHILPEIFEMISMPKFREDYLELIRQQRIQTLRNNLKKNSFVASRLMLQSMFGNQSAAGQPASEESYKAVTIQDLELYHKETFCAENVSLYATGALDLETTGIIRKIFGQICHGKRTAELPLFHMPADSSPIINVEVPDSVQSSLCLAMPHISYADEVRSAFNVLSTISGGYFGSRLMQRIREKHGYTYGIGNGSAYFGRQSIFSIQGDVDATHTQEALDACFDELERLQREPVPEDELQTVKTYMTGSLIQELSTSVAYMSKYAFWRTQHVDHQILQDILHIIQNTNPEDIINIAKNHFTHNNFIQIIVGKKL